MLKVAGIDVYYGELQALWGVDLEVGEGEIVALVGSNGAGKSTCLKAISGLLSPAGGEIRFQGALISRMPAHDIAARGVSYVPEGRRLFPLMTVQENLEMGSYKREARKEHKTLLKQVLDIFPILHERRRQLAGTLSGGEQQMLAIGRGLMGKPKLLLLDEPSLGLAPLLVGEIFRVVEEIRRAGIAVLLVEQNIGDALSIADRGYVLENGRIVLQGSGQDLLRNVLIQRSYLGIA